MSNAMGRTYRKRRLKLKFVPSFKEENNLYVLSEWLGKRGFKPAKKLKPKTFNESGRGLMTEETIRPGDVIVTIPQDLLITPKLVLSSYLGDYFIRQYPKATGHEILSVFLLCEHSKGQTSEWHPYITSLPERYSIPVYFCQQSLDMLPKPIYKSVKLQHDLVMDSFSNLQPLFDELQSAFPVFKNAFNYELYKWAWSSVNTRCIFMECLEDCSGLQCTYHLALAPFLDLLNHSVDVQVRASFNKVKSQYEIISLSTFKKYSQVFISYGCHDNQKLFLEYGFITDNNCNDFIAFSLDDILLAYKLCKLPEVGLSSKLKYIKENNLLRNAVCSNDGISCNLNIIMRILISKHDIRLWSSFIHDAYNQEPDIPEFQKLKMSLINIKLNEYKLNTTNLSCKECSSHEYIISKLCMIINSILIKVLS